jgi:hypothetical protein
MKQTGKKHYMPCKTIQVNTRVNPVKEFNYDKHPIQYHPTEHRLYV